MRWFLRADPLPFVLDALIEGSLVGICYLAVATMLSSATVPLNLVSFWLAAAAGLGAARLRRPRLRLVVSAPAVVIVAGVVGWLADPAARAALKSVLDPMDALSRNPAGWLLALAALRGAIHADRLRESDLSTEAITYAFPLLGVALVTLFMAGHAFASQALVGAGVCVIAGMLAIGYARRREFESSGSVTTGGGVWQLISIGLVGTALVAIPVALILGTVAQDAIYSAARWMVDAGRAPVAWILDFLAWIAASIARLIPNAPPPQIAPHTPVPAETHMNSGPQARPGAIADWRGLIDVLVRVALVAAVIIAALVIRRLVRLRASVVESVPTTAVEERQARPFLLRFHPRIALAALRPRMPFRKRPMTAAQAYLAMLAELEDRGELARAPAETPRNHARRVGQLGLEPVPLAMLAADYQLAVYANVPITPRETARAIGRWERIRAIVRRAPRPD